ncbi:MAG: GNAT family N-acetyltransferase [Terriglobales bacterium]
MPSLEWRRGELYITTDRKRLDLAAIHRFLSEESYWAAGIPWSTVANSVRNSLCFGLFCGGPQIGFARVVTDGATFAYLCDVYVLGEFRGRGLAKWLMECIASHPELQGLRRWMLVTRDAQGLYKQFGFQPLAKPRAYMERFDPAVYAAPPVG